MRISSAQIFLQGLASITNGYSSISKTQNQLATGKRITQAADDPIGVVRVATLGAAINRSEQYTRNASTLEGRLRLEEGAIESSINIIQRVRELAIRANNATETNESRAAVAVEIKQLREDLVQLANSADGNGNHIFGGFQEGSPPFSLNSGVVTYSGDDGRRNLQIGPARYMSDRDPGSAVFMGVPDGNGSFTTTPGTGNTGTGSYNGSSVTNPALYTGAAYTISFTAPGSYEVLDSASTVVGTGSFTSGDSIAFQGVSVTIEGEPAAGDTFAIASGGKTDIFAELSNLITTLETSSGSPVSNAARNTNINQGIEGLDASLARLIGVQTDIGGRMRSVADQIELNADAKLQFQTLRSDLEDVDVPAAATLLSQQLVSLEASQAAFARVQNLSLFNFI